MDRAVELRLIFDSLKKQLAGAEGSGAASIAREMRILSTELLAVEKPKKAAKRDEVAARRESRAGAARPPGRRRQSG